MILNIVNNYLFFYYKKCKVHLVGFDMLIKKLYLCLKLSVLLAYYFMFLDNNKIKFKNLKVNYSILQKLVLILECLKLIQFHLTQILVWFFYFSYFEKC